MNALTLSQKEKPMSYWKAGTWIGGSLLGSTALVAEATDVNVFSELLKHAPQAVVLLVVVVLFLRHIERITDAFERSVNRLADAIDKLDANLNKKGKQS